MTRPAARGLSAAEFLSWAEDQEKGRFELLRGEIVAMAPEQAEHARAKFSAARALADANARVRVPCEAFVDGLGIAINEDTVYEPDALINCGEKIAPDSLLAPNPVVIVEVLSPSTRNIDKSVKVADYFRLPSIAHYLIVDLGRRILLHYERQGAQMVVAIVTEGTIRLDPPGIAIDLADVFP